MTRSRTPPGSSKFLIGDTGERAVFKLADVSSMLWKQHTRVSPPVFTEAPIDLAVLRYIPNAVLASGPSACAMATVRPQSICCALTITASVGAASPRSAIARCLGEVAALSLPTRRSKLDQPREQCHPACGQLDGSDGTLPARPRIRREPYHSSQPAHVCRLTDQSERSISLNRARRTASDCDVLRLRRHSGRSSRT